MSTRRIVLSFNNPTSCGDVAVDINMSQPDPIVESIEQMAARVTPACPICKQPMQYTGFLFANNGDRADSREEPNKPFPGPPPQAENNIHRLALQAGVVPWPPAPSSTGLRARIPTLRQYAKPREYVRAMRWTGEVTLAAAEILGGRAVTIATASRSLSLGNGWSADVGDWIMSADGEKIVAIRDDVFKRSYEEVFEMPPPPLDVEARLKKIMGIVEAACAHIESNDLSGRSLIVLLKEALIETAQRVPSNLSNDPAPRRESTFSDMFGRIYGKQPLRFHECAACAAKPGAPTLCNRCLHNRLVISRLHHALDELFQLADRLCVQIWPAPRSIADRLVELKKEFAL